MKAARKTRSLRKAVLVAFLISLGTPVLAAILPENDFTAFLILAILIMTVIYLLTAWVIARRDQSGK